MPIAVQSAKWRQTKQLKYMSDEIKHNENIPQGGQQIIINQTQNKSNGVGTAGLF